ncbi:MAG: NAD(P)-dependent oxidoreductase [Porticoccaceae bacterium]|nr:NAD(P)-dependent oxidoreductase [Porticoccaceae bacterium]
MNVLLIGFGDLAMRLAPRLVAADYRVAGLRRSEMAFPDVKMQACDCTNPEPLVPILAGCDAVVVTLTPAAFNEEAYRRTYIAGAQALVDALNQLAVKPARILWVSSTSVYGQSNGEWVDETSETEPESFSGKCLLEAEEIIAAGPVPSTIIRFSGIYGPGRQQLINTVKGGHCAPPGPVKWTNRIHSDDCAGALQHLLDKTRAGDRIAPLYLGTDCEPVPLHEVQRWLAQRLGVSVATVPGRSARRGNRRCRNTLLLNSGYRFRYPTYIEGYGALLQDNDW